MLSPALLPLFRRCFEALSCSATSGKQVSLVSSSDEVTRAHNLRMAVFLLTDSLSILLIFLMHTLATPIDLATTKRHQLFTTLVGVVADRHQAYLYEEATVIEACYTLEFHDGQAHIELAQWVPLTLSYELYHCFAKSLE